MEKRTIQVTEQVTKYTKKDMISHALKHGSSARDIASIMGISLETVEAVEKDMLKAV